MDAFWFIPSLIIAVAAIRLFYLRVIRHSASTPTPRVLVDKTTDEFGVHPDIKSQNWSDRPCGSVLEWRAKHPATTQQ